MADWQTRLRESAYTPQGGPRRTFKCYMMRRDVTLRGTVHEFPGVDDAYVQRTGNGPRRYPLLCYFSGPNHDLEALAFEAAVLAPGVGTLEHGRFGPVRVVPFGDVGRREDLVTEANQTILEVTFWTTLEAIYPTADANPQNEILAAIASFNLASGQQFENVVNLASATNKAIEKATINSMLKSVGAAFDGISSSVASVRKVIADAQETINLGMDVLIGKPLVLAQQISNLIQAPSRALAGLESRLDGYGLMFDSIFGSTPGLPANRIDETTSLGSIRQRVANDWHTADLFALNAMAGSILTVTAQPLDDKGRPVRGPIFQNRRQAVAAAAVIEEQLTELIEWRDTQLAAIASLPALGKDQVDSGEAYQTIRFAAALTIGNLVQQSFALIPERSITINRPRTIVDVCAQVYRKVDSRLDFLINTNDLSGDEILELPAGRKIVYYNAA
ncbi:MAG TPA: DNA circularization N-terminal domain-containing protein [Polyangiaceae bacterium]|nr:DNA circularization N-terminal domain-containing protein [Polyangiaceae bacterium]